MASVRRLKEELMGSLGIEVERKNGNFSPPVRRQDRTRSEMDRGGKNRRRSSDSLSVEYPPHALRLRQQRQERPPPPPRESENRRPTSVYDRMVDAKYARPNSARSRRTTPGIRARPASASTAGRDNLRSGICSSGAGSKHMDVLLAICRDQGKGLPLDPTEFDSSISAICNLPVEPFMGAAKEGWGRYFRDLHRAMGEKGLLDRNNVHEGQPKSTRRSRSPMGRQQRPPLERRTRFGQTQAPPSNFRSHQGSNNSATNARRAPNNTRRRREDFDGLAESRARAAKRAEAEDVTRTMALRLHTLWQELKVPEPDRAYVLAAYVGGDCGQAEYPGGSLRKKEGGPPSVEMQRELARQISLLLKYRAATIKVLRAINLRELSLAEVEQALQAFQWHRGRDTDALGLVDALAGLRDASLGVVRAVAEWRKHLWQPRAFCWRGLNYLEKMARDARFLRSPVGESLLASVGLDAGDMTLVLFSSNAEEAIPPPQFGEPEEELAGVRPPPTIVRLTPKAELATEYRSRYFARFIGFDEGDGSQEARAEAKRAEDLVTQEGALQERVEAERVRLVTKGCFVPLLRWLPADRKAARDKRRSSSSTTGPASSEPSHNNHEANGAGRRTDADHRHAEDHNVPVATDVSTPRSLNVPTEARATVTSVRTERSQADRAEQTFPDEARSDKRIERTRIVSEQSDEDYRRLIGQGRTEGARNEGTSKRGSAGRVPRGNELKGGQRCEQGNEQKDDVLPRHGEGSHQKQTRFGGEQSRYKAPDEAHEEGYSSDNGTKRGEDRLGNIMRTTQLPVDVQRPPKEADGRVREGEEGHERQSRSSGVGDDNVLSTRDVGDEIQLNIADKPGQVDEDLAQRATMEGHETPGGADGGRSSSRGNILERREENDKSSADDDTTGEGSGHRGRPGAEDLGEVKIKGMAKILTTEVSNSSVEEETEGTGGSDGGVGDDVHRHAEEETESRTSQVEQEGCDGSVTHSLLYDDDFDEDVNDYSFSDPESNDDYKIHDGSRSGDKQDGKVGEEAADAEASEEADAVGGEDGAPRNSNSVVIIQCAWRQKVAAGKTELERLRRREKEENDAATKIQQAARAAAEEKQNRRRRVEEETCKQESAKKLQAWLVAWRAKRETQVRRTQRDAAVRIQSTVRKKRASDEVFKLRRVHETRRSEALCGESYHGELPKESVMTAEVQASEIPGEDARSTELTSERKNSSATKIQTAVREAKRRRSSSSSNDGARSPLTDSGGLAKKHRTGTEKHGPGVADRDGSATDPSSATSSAHARTLTTSSSSLESTDFRSPSSSTSDPSLGERPGSLDNGRGDDNASSGDSNNGRSRLRADDDASRRQEPATATVGGVESASLEAAGDGDVPFSPAQGDELAMEREGFGVASSGDLGTHIDTESGALCGASDDASTGAGNGTQGYTNPPSNIGAVINGSDVDLIALSPVPEVRALGPGSEYGSEDLTFDALSSTPGSVGSVALAGVKASESIASVGAQEDAKSDGTGVTDGVSNDARDQGARESRGDSDGSLMSLSTSSGS